MFVFRRITLFCLEKRLSEHKNPTFSKNLEGEKTPLDPPDYAYGLITVKVSVRVSILPGLSIYRARVQSISCNPSFRSSLSCTLRIPCIHGSAAAFCSLQRKKAARTLVAESISTLQRNGRQSSSTVFEIQEKRN